MPNNNEEIFQDALAPVQDAFEQKWEKLSPRQTRQLNFISQFSSDIRHISGADNLVADMLSRIETFALPSPVDLQQLHDEQSKCEELKGLLDGDPTSLQLIKYRHAGTGIVIICDKSTGVLRPYVPKILRRIVFNASHGLAHPGAKATIKLISKSYVWKKMSGEIRSWVRSCQACQRCKISRHTKAELEQFTVPARRFEHVNVDIVGPFTPSRGFTYCLTCVDRFSRWLEVIPLADMTAETVARQFLAGWISRFGAPKFITTDQGRQFESALFKELAKLMGVRHIHTTSYHPQANGMVERWHRVLKAALRCHSADANWVDVLPLVLLGLRTAVKEDLGVSVAEMVYGQSIRLPGDFMEPEEGRPIDQNSFLRELQRHFESVRPIQTSQHGKPAVFVPKDLRFCSHVFLRDDTIKKPLKSPYDGPYLVVSRYPKTYTIMIGSRPVSVSVDRLKPAYFPRDELATLEKSTIKSWNSASLLEEEWCSEYPEPTLAAQCGNNVKQLELSKTATNIVA